MSDKVLEFGTKRENEIRRDGGCAVVFDPKTQKYAVGRCVNGLLILYSGGVEAGEDIQKGVLREVKEESGLHDFEHVEKLVEAMVHYYHSGKKLNRVAFTTCFLAILKSTNLAQLHLEAHENFVLDWAEPDEIIKNWQKYNQNHDHDHWIYFLKKGVSRTQELGYDTTNKLM
jgi:ADP-ribose pyrophosphatase YjhB (NUDIX family)